MAALDPTDEIWGVTHRCGEGRRCQGGPDDVVERATCGVVVDASSSALALWIGLTMRPDECRCASRTGVMKGRWPEGAGTLDSDDAKIETDNDFGGGCCRCCCWGMSGGGGNGGGN